MSLFNLTDIKYKQSDTKFVQKDGLLDNPSSSNKDISNTLRYPIDLGNKDKAHYMLIHINVQEKTAYSSQYDYAKDPLSTIQRNRKALSEQVGAVNIGGVADLTTDNLKKVGIFLSDTTRQLTPDAAKEFLNKSSEAVSGLLNQALDKAGIPFPRREEAYRTLQEGFGGARSAAEAALGSLNGTTFLRTTKRTKHSIALYMPGTMAYTNQQNYNNLQMGGERAAFYGAGLSLLNDAVRGKISAEQLGKNLTPFIGEKLKEGLSSIIGQNSAQAIFASAFGAVQNPQLELIYTSPSLRNFRFDFMFYPSSPKEATEVNEIVRLLKFHQAPEILSGSAGYFLVPPSEFDIEFCYNGQINPNIPKISTCVLTSIYMDYAPKGWAAYEDTKDINKPTYGATGMPFAIRLSLSFQETEVMTKFNYQSIPKSE